MEETLPHSGLIGDLSYYTERELQDFGFYRIGKNHKVSRKCSFYAINGTLGDDVRIDDFCIIKGKVDIGHNVHICAYSMISGAQCPVFLDDFCVLSVRCSIFTGSNNHNADALPAPLAPKEYTLQSIGPVAVGKAVMVGAHVVILPGTVLCDGSSVGAGCVVARSLDPGEMLRGRKPEVLHGRVRNVRRMKEFMERYFSNKAGEV